MKNTHLLRCSSSRVNDVPSGYALFRGIPGALHLGIFDQPGTGVLKILPPPATFSISPIFSKKPNDR
jgi:hypothetical protein